MGILFSSAEVIQGSPCITLLCVLCSFRADIFSLQKDVGTGSGVQSWSKEKCIGILNWSVFFSSPVTLITVWDPYLDPESEIKV